jgi:hypothetical protein
VVNTAALTFIKVLIGGDAGSVPVGMTVAAAEPGPAGKKKTSKKAVPVKRTLGQLDVDAVMQV